MKNKVNGWKVLSLLLLALGALLLCCFTGVFLGGLWGYQLGRSSSIARQKWQMQPESPWEQMPDLVPEEPPFAPPAEDDAWLGVAYEMTPEGAEILQVLVDTPAEEAGLQFGDLVVEIDGESVTELNTLGDIILSHSPGDRIELLVSRDGELLEIKARLGRRPNTMPLEQPYQLPPLPGEG